jgi:hypothetical protein
MAVIGRAVTESDGKESILMDVLDAVATTTDTPMEELPPLQDTLNVQALIDLYSRSKGGPEMVAFIYYGCRVTIEEERIVVRPDEA